MTVLNLAKLSRELHQTREFSQLITLATDVVMQLITSIVLPLFYCKQNGDWRWGFLHWSLMFLLVIRYRHVARKVTREGMRAMANVNSTIKETISALPLQRIFDRRKHLR